MRYLAIIILVVVIGSNVFAQETSVTSGILTEENTGRYDYSVNYNVVQIDKLRLQYDNINNPTNYKRFWVSGSQYQLIKGFDINLSFRPGVIFDNRQHIWYGGFFDLDLPKVGLSSQYRCYAGNRFDKHIIFTDFKLAKNFYLQHYYYTESSTWTPDSYLGPRITSRLTLGKSKFNLDFAAGTSLTRPGANYWDLSISTKF